LSRRTTRLEIAGASDSGNRKKGAEAKGRNRFEAGLWSGRALVRSDKSRLRADCAAGEHVNMIQCGYTINESVAT
jgi:hypothetical protein